MTTPKGPLAEMLAYHREWLTDNIQTTLDRFFEEVNPENMETEDLAVSIVRGLERPADAFDMHEDDMAAERDFDDVVDDDPDEDRPDE
jgi:hypothetical protein